MNFDGKKILVTGADGFIGSHLVQGLMDRGCDVRAFVFYNSFNSWGWLDTLPPEKARVLDVFAGDIRDPNGVAKTMEGCDVVFHLAALIAILFSYHSPDSYVDTNIKGTLNVLQAARRFDTERVVVTSTSEVYGTASEWNTTVSSFASVSMATIYTRRATASSVMIFARKTGFAIKSLVGLQAC